MMEIRDARRTDWLWIDNKIITEYGAEGQVPLALQPEIVYTVGAAD